MEQKGFGVQEMKLRLRPLGSFRIYECRRGSKSSFFEREETLEASPREAVGSKTPAAWRVVGGAESGEMMRSGEKMEANGWVASLCA